MWRKNKREKLMEDIEYHRDHHKKRKANVEECNEILKALHASLENM